MRCCGNPGTTERHPTASSCYGSRKDMQRVLPALDVRGLTVRRDQAKWMLAMSAAAYDPSEGVTSLVGPPWRAHGPSQRFLVRSKRRYDAGMARRSDSRFAHGWLPLVVVPSLLRISWLPGRRSGRGNPVVSSSSRRWCHLTSEHQRQQPPVRQDRCWAACGSCLTARSQLPATGVITKSRCRAAA
jgi:hypothetical protein